MLLLTILRVLATIGAIVLVYRFAAADRSGRQIRGGWPEYLLLNLALLSVVLHTSFSPYPPSVLVNKHDIFHYYMGSKYSREVGYFDLYPCTVVADSDNAAPGTPVPKYLIRKMDDYSHVWSTDVIRDAERYRSLFSADRWEEFKADVAVFRSEFGSKVAWTTLLGDNGYNATPVWSMIARAVTNVVSVQTFIGLFLLASLDPLLLGLMFFVLWKAFGRSATLLALVLLGSMFVMADGTIRGAFLRFDWLALLVMATCCLKLDRYKTAGALAAYAGAARIFPLAFAFGLGAKCLWELVSTRRIARRYLEFFVTFSLVIVVLVGGSLLADGGTETWESFWSKIRFHDTHMSHLRVGFKPLLLAGAAPFMNDWPAHATMRALRFGELRTVWWALQVLVLTAAFFAVRRLKDYETMAIGWVVVYFLFAPAFYYQVVLLVPALLFLPKLRERARAHGLALLFGISLGGYFFWILQNMDKIAGGSLEWCRLDYDLSLKLDGALLIFAMYVLGVALYRAFGSPSKPAATSR
jgi:hypothetical protein